MYAVDVYLQCRGFETNLGESVSWDPAMQTLMDVADLVLQNHERVECRPVLPNAEILRVPPKAWGNRIGYIAVQLDGSLREATLLGFVDKVARSEVPLSQLRSLGELPGYLNKIRPLVNLSQWFENIFEAGWQAVEALLSMEPRELAVSFRSALEGEVRRCKLIGLGASGQSVAMVVAITQASEQEMDISVEVQPPIGQTYLPPDLQLVVHDEEGEAVIDARARSDNRTIQLGFSG